jgi:ParB-like chromosome segregation protein Spo0J
MKANKASGELPQLTACQFERYEIAVVDRRLIKNAPYNPRSISEQARANLKRIISKHGLVEPIVWNKQTGNIVGGHRRLEILDTLEGKKEYTIRVSQVDIDLAAEKSLNIALNNPAAQGDYEYEMLEKLFKEDKVNYEDSGYSQADMLRLFGRDITIDAAAVIKDDQGRFKALEEMAKKVEEYADRRDRMFDSLEDANDQDFYSVIVFKSFSHRKLLTDKLGMPENRYIDGKTVLLALGIDIATMTDQEILKKTGLDDKKKENDNPEKTTTTPQGDMQSPVSTT